MRKGLFLAATAGLALALAAPAHAAITFCPTAGTCYYITSMDPAVGNALSMGLNGSTTSGDGTLLFQANLDSAYNGSTNVYSQGDLNTYFTFAAVFDEGVASNSGGTLTFTTPTSAGADATFGTFAIYAQSTDGSNLDGYCFVDCTNDSSNPAILTGTFINDPSTFYGNFTVNSVAGAVQLDQYPDPTASSDDWSGQLTAVGGGSFSAEILVTGVNSAYFPGLNIGDTFIFATTQQVLPFRQADPSYCFSSDAVSSCDVNAVGTLGTVNGVNGSNTILQTDASLSFVSTPEIPEPATLTLFGLGLLGTAGARKLRRRNKKRNS